MNEIREIRPAPDDIGYELSVVRYERAFRKLIQTLKAGFDEHQPRDVRGRWTAEGQAGELARRRRYRAEL